MVVDHPELFVVEALPLTSVTHDVFRVFVMGQAEHVAELVGQGETVG